jgi:methylmalonyl-CoA mutase C-terminal domain/subunit
MNLLKEQDAEDILVIGGGVIPNEDIPGLLELGIGAIFTPGTSTETTINFIKEHIARS